MTKITSWFCVLVFGMGYFTETVRAAEKFALTDDFFAYLKLTTNPHEFGLRQDGRFYPYSTPRGRRVGYAQPFADKAIYRQGQAKADADALLRLAVERAALDVERHLAEHFPSKPFSALNRKGQEMLVDAALSEGAKNISPVFIDAVMSENWDKLFNEFIYLRWVEKGWPDTLKNKAFADRWLPYEMRIRPSVY